jgi:hypothetical protein
MSKTKAEKLERKVLVHLARGLASWSEDTTAGHEGREAMRLLGLASELRGPEEPDVEEDA